MNILFRKNFHVESSGERGFGGMGGSKPSKGVLNKGRRSRECGGYSHMEEHHFRTHIFLSPPAINWTTNDREIERFESRAGVQRVGSPEWFYNLPPCKCGGRMRQLLGLRLGVTAPPLGYLDEVGWWGVAPDANPAAGLKRASPLRRPHPPPPDSFSKGANPIPAPPPTVTKEPITLATLNRDCFIIPVASLDRFLPAGVPLYLKVVCWVEKELLATKTNQRCETYLIFEGRLTTRKQKEDNAISQ
uniref:Uncharacterized protein n=1 Tax=Timema monikensis TaxID=170555 RepID=A0A7R9ED84_9NEOP|nr:unnamed protein product [Timema monikensis]